MANPSNRTLSREEFTYLVNTLSASVDRLTETTQELAIGVAAQTQRLNHMEERNDELKELAAQTIITHAQDNRAAHERIQQVKDGIEKQISAQTEQVTRHIDDMSVRLSKDITDTKSALGDRIKVLEHWQWMVKGAIGLLAALLAGIGWKAAELWLRTVASIK